MRRVVAQAALLVVVGASFLTWFTGDGGYVGTRTGDGQLAAVVGLVTMGLVTLRWRPAWIGAGLIVAVLARRVIDFGDRTGIGLWLGLIAAVVAAAMLIWEMFSAIPRPDDN